MAVLRNTRSRYGWVAIALHWVMGLTILGMYPLGLYIDSLTYYDTAYRTVPHWHKGIGILLAGCLVLRLLWKWNNPTVSHLATYSRLTVTLAKCVHGLLYLLIAGVVCSGYFISTADGRGIEVFNWFTVPAMTLGIEQQEDIAGTIHFWLATTLIVLACLHILAALKHHFIDKDATLRRMLGR